MDDLYRFHIIIHTVSKCNFIPIVKYTTSKLKKHPVLLHLMKKDNTDGFYRDFILFFIPFHTFMHFYPYREVNFKLMKSKKISKDQELIQSDSISCPTLHLMN